MKFNRTVAAAIVAVAGIALASVVARRLLTRDEELEHFDPDDA